MASKSAFIFFLFLVACCSIFSFSYSARSSTSSTYSYSPGDYFKYKETAEVSGLTSNYEGYSGTYTEIGTYRVLSVINDTVVMKASGSWSWYDNEGEQETSSFSVIFNFSASSRKYFDPSSSDADPINRGPYIWFRVNPNDFQIGNTIQLLAIPQTVTDLSSITFFSFTPIEGVKLVATGTRTRSDDFATNAPTSYEDTWWFDKTTGWVLKEVFKETVYSNEGNFKWVNTFQVTEASYPLPKRNDLFLIWGLEALLVLFALLGIRHFAIHALASRRVTLALKTLKGTYKPPSPGNAPTIWKPASIPFETLLELSEDKSYVFKDGIYLISDTTGSLAIVDVYRDRKTYLTLPSDHPLIKVLFKLSLGTATAVEVDELTKMVDPSVSLSELIEPATQIAPFDRKILDLLSARHFSLFSKQGSPKSQFVIGQLLARRRFLDFAHGQAPLDVRSHLKKVEIALKFPHTSVIMIGDDDLISVTLARLGISVLTLEIDPYTCALLTQIAKEENLPLQVRQLDFREPLPHDLLGKYDLFIADPDFTLESFALFLSRGMECLRLGGIGLINYERTAIQQQAALKLLKELNIPLKQHIKDKWTYITVQNVQVPVRSSYSALRKTHYVSYRSDLIITTARFSSSMFILEKSGDFQLPVAYSTDVSDVWIYDY